MTEAAVKSWQAKNGVVSSGTPSTTGYGAVGPKTRTKIGSVCAMSGVTNTPLASSCVLDGVTLTSGSAQIFYSARSVAIGSQCSSISQARVCSNGVLSGSASHQYATCSGVAGGTRSCTLDGVTIAHNSANIFYSARTVSGQCSSIAQSRTCIDATLSGSASYQYASCTGESAQNRIKLSAPLVLYLNASGSDSNDCLTTATACKTRLRAWTLLRENYDLQGQHVTILSASGVYSDAFTARGALTGQVSFTDVVFQGDTAQPSNVLIRPSGSDDGYCNNCDNTIGNAFGATDGASFVIQGFHFDMTNSRTDTIVVGDHSKVGIAEVVFGYNIPPYFDIQAAFNSYVDLFGSFVIQKPAVTTSASFEAGSTDVRVANLAGIKQNMGVTGPGIPSNAYVASVSADAHVTIAGGVTSAAKYGIPITFTSTAGSGGAAGVRYRFPIARDIMIQSSNGFGFDNDAAS